MDKLEIPCIRSVNGIPDSHRDCTFENFDFSDCTELKKYTLSFLKNEKPFWMYLWGQTGRGKTHYAVALHRAMVAQIGWEAADSSTFIEWNVLVREARKSFGDHTYDSLMENWLECETFVIDDIIGKLADFQVRILEEVIRDRFAQNRRLVVTSNEPFDTFLGYFGSHEVSRIQSCCLVVEFIGEDRRQQ